MPPKQRGKRSRSAPPAARGAEAPAGATANAPEVTELEVLPDGKGYESLDENDGPPQPSPDCLVLEDEELVGLDEHAPKDNPDGAPPAEAAAAAVLAGLGGPAPPGPPTIAGVVAATPISPEDAARFSPRRRTQATEDGPTARPSPTRAATVATGAPAAEKKLTAAQERSKQSAAEWNAWDVKEKTPLRFGRPEFRPYKDGTGPAGFVPLPRHAKGAAPDGHGFTSQTHPALFVAAQGFDGRMFTQLEDATNEYAASKGAGKSTFWKEWKPFDAPEIMAGCGLLLRAGVAPTPQIELVFKDPSMTMSFVWGDERVHKVWTGEGCGGSARRFVQFRSFLHIQNWNESEYKKTDPATGEFVKLDWKTKGPMAKCEPMMSYCRYKWSKGWLPGKSLSLDEMTLGFKGRCALARILILKRFFDRTRGRLTPIHCNMHPC